MIGYMILVRNKMERRPPRDRRRVKGLCVENECFVLFIIAIVLSVGYQYIAVVSKKAQRTHV